MKISLRLVLIALTLLPAFVQPAIAGCIEEVQCLSYNTGGHYFDYSCVFCDDIEERIGRIQELPDELRLRYVVRTVEGTRHVLSRSYGRIHPGAHFDPSLRTLDDLYVTLSRKATALKNACRLTAEKILIESGC